MATTEKRQYESFAPKHDSVENLPCSHLEGQLIQAALGNCAGLKVLDLGGDSGLHARRVIDAGADIVHLVDISPAMMEIAQSIEVKLGRAGRIKFYEADAFKPLTAQSVDLLPPGQYDIVMAIGSLTMRKLSRISRACGKM